MFRITWDPLSGSDSLFLIEITRNAYALYRYRWPVRLCHTFSTLSQKLQDFRNKKKATELEMCFDFLHKLSLKHLSFSAEQTKI